MTLDKVTHYLLSDSHPYGRHKARMLRSLGFTRADPDALMAALLTLARSGILTETDETLYGVKHVVVGLLRGPTGSMGVRTVWMTRKGTDGPVLVTCRRD